MDTTLFTQLGLNPKSATVYETLLKRGPLPAQSIASETKLKRPTVYVLVDELKKAGLVTERKVGLTGQVKKTVFAPEHPNRLQDLVASQEQELGRLKQSFEGTLPSLRELYALASERPGVRVFVGKDGLKAIYDDILATGKDFLLVRTPQEKSVFPEVVHRFIDKRVEKGIKVRALTPRHPGAKPQKDKSRLFSRTWVSLKDYTAPVEIDIYGDKVAFLSFGKELIGAIIESTQITGAMRELFALAETGATSVSPVKTPQSSQTPRPDRTSDQTPRGRG